MRRRRAPRADAAPRGRPDQARRRAIGAFLKRLAANPALWLLLAAASAMPYARPLFAALFPHLQRPLYEQDGFLTLLGLHAALVGASSVAATAIGVGAGVFAARNASFRPIIEQAASVGQTVPPVAVLALSVPAMGYGAGPALIALTLYGVLPILRNTLAGLDGVAQEMRDAARGMGMTPRQRLLAVELPLAAPVILAGVRVSAVVNVGTAAIASTVGVRTLGTPIIVGLNGSNLAYVFQGALLTGLLAVALDHALTSGRRGPRGARSREQARPSLRNIMARHGW